MPEPPDTLQRDRSSGDTSPLDTTILFRPVGAEELELIAASGWRHFPPRLPGQPIFYPVLNLDYAVQIARDWNASRSGAGYVTRFAIDASFAARYEIRTVGASNHQELWVPADKLPDFNQHIVGLIEVLAEFHTDAPSGRQLPSPASDGAR